MITSLTIQGVCGQTSTYQFKMRNVLTGKNGTGKSTVLQALAFAYAGTDTGGARAPTRLIDRGADAMKVTVGTTKATLDRSLTRKGSQTIGLEFAGARVTLSQQELSARLGLSPDAFLSAVVPAYLLRLPTARQQAVLAEVLPKLDRRAILMGLSSDLADADPAWALIDLTKRVDLAGTRVTAHRRTLAAQLEHARGSRHVLARDAGAVLAAPTPPDGGQGRLAAFGKLRDEWRSFETRHQAWKRARQDYDYAAQQNVHRAAEREAALAAAAAVTVPPLGPAINVPEAAIDQLQARLKGRPAKPVMVHKIDEPRCPACGQMVSSKHKERVSAEFQKQTSEWEAVCAENTAHDEIILGEIAALRRQYAADCKDLQEAGERHLAASRKKSQIEAHAAALTPLPLPSVPAEPIAPSEPYQEAPHRQLEQVWQEYERARGSYEADARRTEGAAAEMQKMDQQITQMIGEVARYERIEEALARLPQEELARQTSMLHIPGYALNVGEGLTFQREDAAPYEDLSMGERMRAAVYLCWKLNQLLREQKRPAPAVVFIDDADLLDHAHELTLELARDSIQTFVAHVSHDQAQLSVVAVDD